MNKDTQKWEFGIVQSDILGQKKSRTKNIAA